jgi:hypothetical protein
MNGSNKRRWFRVAPRGLVPRIGKILLGPKTIPIECHIVDLSAGGACLELPRERFEFLHGNTKRFCTLAWARGFRIEISYEGTLQRSSVSGGLSRPKNGNCSPGSVDDSSPKLARGCTIGYPARMSMLGGGTNCLPAGARAVPDRIATR